MMTSKTSLLAGALALGLMAVPRRSMSARLDLSRGSADVLGLTRAGVGSVSYERL